MLRKKLTHYDVLGVQEDANLDEIRKAFRRQAIIWHPDRNRIPGAHERICAINAAYEMLSDEASRRRYDVILQIRRRFQSKGKIMN